MSEFNEETERILAVSQLRHSIHQVMEGISMIKNIQMTYPKFTKAYYSQIPRYSMGELGEWLLAANQARDNLANRRVLFGPPDKTAQDIYLDTLKSRKPGEV